MNYTINSPPSISCIQAAEKLQLHRIAQIIEKCKAQCSLIQSNPHHLTKDEIVALVLFSSDLGANLSHETFFFNLNKVLQKRNAVELLPWQNVLYYVKTAFDKIPSIVPKGYVMVYQGTQYSDDFKPLVQGQKITLTAFTIASKSPITAVKFAGSNGIVLCMEVCAGKSINEYSCLQNDGVVLSPNTEFKVKKPLSTSTFFLNDGCVECNVIVLTQNTMEIGETEVKQLSDTQTPLLPNWIINDDDPSFCVTKTKETRLGEGSYGVVFLAKYCGEYVAAKTMFALQHPELYGYDDSELIEIGKEILHEFEIQSYLQHPNIIIVKGAVVNSKQLPIWILSEYMANGSLDSLLKKHRKGIPVLPIVQICLNVLCALSYLHDIKEGMHRDIKPANILISNDGICKLCDFGISKINWKSKYVESMSFMNTLYKGTARYRAPEVDRTPEYTEKVDIWSIGVVIVELVLGLPEENVLTIDVDGAKLKCPSIANLLNFTLQKDPNARLPASKLIEMLPNNSVVSPALLIDLCA